RGDVSGVRSGGGGPRGDALSRRAPGRGTRGDGARGGGGVGLAAHPARARERGRPRPLGGRPRQRRDAAAIPAIRALLAEHPRDMLLLQRLYFIYFWQGRSAEMLELTHAIRGAFGDDSVVLG